MTERKPAGVSFESWVDVQIREAHERGEFDNLPGKGKPLKGLDGPQDDMWWIKQWLKRENLSFTPQTLALRKAVEDTLAGIGRLRSEQAVRDVLGELNKRIREMNRMPPMDGPPTSLGVIDVERIVTKWEEQRAAAEPDAAVEHSNAPSATWSNPRAEARFRAIEDELWHEECATPPTAIDVETTAGMTRVYRWPGSGPAVVALHGMGGTAIQWARLARELVGHDLYAIDTMGDVGRSVYRQPFHDCAHVDRWLAETITALGLGRVHLIGNNYGAYLAMRRATSSPEATITLTLLDPAGFWTRGPRMVGRLLLTAIAGLLPGPARRWMAKRIGIPALADKRLVRAAFLATRHHPFRLPMPTAVTDAELGALAMPTLVLVGAKTAMYEPTALVARMRAVVPDIEAEVVAGFADALFAHASAGVGRRVSDFLVREPSSGR